MSPVAIFSRKWVRKSSIALHDALSSLIFLFLDFFDAILCVFYKFIDEIFEEEAQGCYCTAAPNYTTSENEQSESLFRRKNIFREMGFLGFTKRLKLSRKIKNSKINRWSDCGCQSCIAWTKNEEQNLHIVVKDCTFQENSVQEPVENVIFIHGFMGSSNFWTETVFEHIKKDHYRLFAIDLLGFGESPKPKESLYTLKEHVEMIEKSVIKRYQLHSFHVVAHSMGGLIALSLAAKHSKIVESVILVAPPYVSTSLDGTTTAVLSKVAGKRLWPPLAFGSAVMSWYEHVGRCVCFIVCKHHNIWEWLIKLCTGTREIHWKIKDITKHTHHSAWHSMHNVICGGSKFTDQNLETLINSNVKIYLMQGDCDKIVPRCCVQDMKMKFPEIDVDIVENADHESVISGRREEFAKKLENIWCLCRI